MTKQHTRRDVLRGTLAAAGLGMLGIPEWALPALAQGETLVPFTDAPPTFPAPGPVNRQYDVRTIDGPFYAGRSVLHDPALRPSRGRAGDIPLESNRACQSAAVACRSTSCGASAAQSSSSGSSARATAGRCKGSVGNGRWTGVPLRAVLDRAGLKAQVRELVFFGADRGQEEVEFRTQKFSRRTAVRPEPDARTGADVRRVSRVGAQRRTADPPPGIAAATAGAGMVRHGQRQVARADPRAGRRVSRQVPGAALPHAARRND